MALPNSSKLTLMLVEDDLAVARAVQDRFEEDGIAVQHVSTIADGLRLLSERHPFDAIVLDLSLPDGDGFQIADAVRVSSDDTPIIMLTARDSVDERIAGLSRGADDYLVKPFAVEELVARLEAVLRRSQSQDRYVLKYHDIELDVLTRTVRRQNLQKNISAREVDLLAFFMRHPEQTLSKERILREVWGEGPEFGFNVLHVYANYLRNTLGGAAYPPVIHTIRGVGYVLSQANPEDGPPNDEPPAAATSTRGRDSR